jgi:protoporphyrinogen/coproporphyrinogen III oxidase
MTRRVVIVGGGITGLAAAYRLRKSVPSAQDLDLTLVDAQPRLGGSAWTEQRNGFIMEAGADSFLTTKPQAVALVRELGLLPRLVGLSTRKVYIVHRRQLHPLPEGFALAASPRLGAMARTSLLSPWGKARAMADLVRPPNRSKRDESVASFVKRRLGREVLDRIAGPLIGGIYAADPERLSADSVIPQLRSLEREHGSVILGLRASEGKSPPQNPKVPAPFASFPLGMQELADTLVDATPGVAWRTGARAERVEREPDGRFTVVVKSGEALPADAVLLATPSHVSAGIVGVLDRGLAEALETIPYASSVTVTLAFSVSDCRLPEGSGFLVARDERIRLKACTFASSKFPNRAPVGQVLLRAFYGGREDEGIVGAADAELVDQALSDLGPILSLRGSPGFSRVHRWPRVHPQYEVGHADRVAVIEAACANVPGLLLAGSAYRGVGIPDCIRDAEARVRTVLTYLKLTPTSVPGTAAGTDSARFPPEGNPVSRSLGGVSVEV